MKPATPTKPRARLVVVKARKMGIVTKQVLTNPDQAERWKKLCKENGYEIVK